METPSCMFFPVHCRSCKHTVIEVQALLRQDHTHMEMHVLTDVRTHTFTCTKVLALTRTHACTHSCIHAQRDTQWHTTHTLSLMHTHQGGYLSEDVQLQKHAIHSVAFPLV